MATTSLIDVWDPDVWISGVQEQMNKFPALVNSPAVTTIDRLTEFASGKGITINMPVWSDLTDQPDEVQQESTDITKNKHTTAIPIATALERQWGYEATALTSQRTGEDPVNAALATLAQGRAKRMQTALLNMIRGIYATALAANSFDNFSETIAGQTADHLIDADMVLDGNALLGENMRQGSDTVLWMHPDIMIALRKQDENNFSSVSTQGGFTITTYKGAQIYLSKDLVRAGTTDGFVYDTYGFGAGMVGKGEKPQVGDRVDVASLQYDPNFSKNDEGVYDRNRYALHVDGMIWGGTPALASASNAELIAGANWSLGLSSADRYRMFRIQSNG